MIGTVVSNLCNKHCKLPKVTGVTSNGNVVSIVGKDIDLDTQGKVIEILNKNNLKFNNLDRTKMQISVTVDEKDLKNCICCIHDLFFKK